MSNKRSKSRQEKMVESVLTKAKKYVKDLDCDFEVGDKGPIPSEGDGRPPSKKRKPRHESDEGQLFLAKKAKANVVDSYLQSLEKSNAVKGKNKKKKNKNKKSKGQQKPQDNSSTLSKQPESQDRQRNEALSYLQLWKSHKNLWKFETRKQLWLLKHATSVELIDDKLFPTLIEYIGSIQGVCRTKTLQEMENFMSVFESKFGSSSNPNSLLNYVNAGEDDGKKEKVSANENEQKEYDRAREIVQMLSDV